jgi:hypothetical protein
MYTNENFSFVPGKGYKDCGITLPVVTRELAGFNRKTREFDLPVANEVGVYRATPDGDPVYLAVVGAGYEVVQTAPLLKTAEDAFRRVCTPEQLVGGYYLDEASYHGAQVQRSYILPAVQPMDRDMQGRLGFRMVVSNGYDGRVKVGLLHGFVDFYCTNGMFIGTDIDSFERKHTSGFSLRLMERFEIEAADRGRNLWAVVSAMTYYSSHDSDEFTIRGSETNDNVSATLMQRQLEVRRWMDGSAWQRLLAA